MLIARPEFPMFEQIGSVMGIRMIGVPYEHDLGFPYRRFEESAGEAKPDSIIFINPDNPTGTAVDIGFIAETASKYPSTPVIVDEAYFEFTGQTVSDLTATSENVIVLRSFSKAFAMAGLRLGYVIAHPATVEQLSKLRGPFNVNSLAVVAAQAQLAAIEEVYAHARDLMTTVKPMVLSSLERLGTKVWPGSANFLLVEPQRSLEAVEYLYSQQILVRPMHSPRLKGLFRVSLGTLDEMVHFIQVFERYVKGEFEQACNSDSHSEDIPRRNLDPGPAGGRLGRSDTVRISSYFRTL